MSLVHGGNIMAVARQHGWDWRDVTDFSASINPLGPSPAVRQAILAGIERIAHYPEREPTRLTAALAKLWNVGETQILMGNGATELIYFLARSIAVQPVTLALPVFSEFHRAFPLATSADLQRPETWPSDRLLVLTRPANPLGSTLSIETLQNWLLATRNPVLIDESFLEFSQQPSAGSLVSHRPGLMILRSLTKFYALPGLRIGALIAEEATVNQWKAHREPWQVNVLAEEASLAAIADTAHAAQSLACVTTERRWLHAQIESLPGATPRPSDANFLYVLLNYPAERLYQFLLAHKILIRVCTGWPGLAGESVRIAVRSKRENQRLIELWRQFPCDC